MDLHIRESRHMLRRSRGKLLAWLSMCRSPSRAQLCVRGLSKQALTRQAFFQEQGTVPPRPEAMGPEEPNYLSPLHALLAWAHSTQLTSVHSHCITYVLTSACVCRKREQRIQDQKLRETKTLGASEPQGDDMLSWVARTRMLEQERAKASRMAAHLQEQVRFLGSCKV